nr:DUF6089 family protein [Mangrovivirga halotolerans]
MVIFFTEVNLKSQELPTYKEVGVAAGGAAYIGEVVKTVNPLYLRPSLGVFYRQNMNEFMGWRAQLTYNNLAGDDSRPADNFSDIRSTSFNVSILELMAVGEFHFLDYRQIKSPYKTSPYIFAGVGGFWLFGDDPGPYSYSNIQPVIPFGAGMKWKLNRHWHLGVELGFRKTFFDYIDGVSEVPDTNAGLNKGAAGYSYQYGNKYDNDWYYNLHFTLNYVIIKIPCPVDPN